MVLPSSSYCEPNISVHVYILPLVSTLVDASDYTLEIVLSFLYFHTVFHTMIMFVVYVYFVVVNL